jgi:hypothetical protein
MGHAYAFCQNAGGCEAGQVGAIDIVVVDSQTMPNQLGTERVVGAPMVGIATGAGDVGSGLHGYGGYAGYAFSL